MIVYKATNSTNGKAYIGMTEDLSFRQWTHFNDAKNGSDQVFHRAIRKYGEDMFTWEVLKELNTREEAGMAEVKLIEQHNTFKSGYNSTTGGEWGWTVSDETRAKMSRAGLGKKKSKQHAANIAAANIGLKKTDEVKAKISASQMGNKYRVGTKHSDETKRKIKESCSKAALRRYAT